MSFDSSRQSGFVLNPWVVIAVGLILIAVLSGWAILSGVLSEPASDPGGPLRLEAPSGERAMVLTETCGDSGCQRTATYELAQGGETIRLDCALDLSDETPLFANVTAQWLADETILRVDYADAEGQGGSLLFDLVADCRPDG